MTRPSILFVDDEPNLLSGLRRLTRSRMDIWDLAFAASGAEALDLLEDRPVHLVVTDMRMPGMDGAELLEAISERAPGIIRFALSGETDAQQAIRIAGKSHRFLAKPIDPDALFTAIDGLFANNDTVLEENRKRNRSVFDMLVAMPGRLAAFEAQLAQPTPDGIAINAQIMADPSLSMRVLQLANSAYFGKPLKTFNLPRAIGYVGLSRLTQLVERGRLGSAAAAASATADAHKTCTMAAVIARETAVAKGLEPELQDLAYVTALFSGVGTNAQDDGMTCLSRPGCIATLFGLPPILAQCLSHFDRQGIARQSETEIADAALAIVREAMDEAKEAA